MVAFFHSALDHPFASEFLIYFIGTSSIYVIFPCLEAMRQTKGRSLSVWGRMLGYPEAWLGLSQVASLGVTMSLYGLVFAMASIPTQFMPAPSTVSKEAHHLPPGQAHRILRIDAQAIAVATVLGAAVPSIALFAYRNPSITVLWQAFPLYILLARVSYWRIITMFSHRDLSTDKHQPVKSVTLYSDDGFKSVRLILLLSFALSSYFHISFISSILGRPDLVSSLRRSNELRGADALSLNVLVFLLWDFVFSFLSALLALGLDAIASGRKITESKSSILGSAVGCLLVGPGAMVTMCVLWREQRMRSGLTIG